MDNKDEKLIEVILVTKESLKTLERCGNVVIINDKIEEIKQRLQASDNTEFIAYAKEDIEFLLNIVSTTLNI